METTALPLGRNKIEDMHSNCIAAMAGIGGACTRTRAHTRPLSDIPKHKCTYIYPGLRSTWTESDMIYHLKIYWQERMPPGYEKRLGEIAL